MSNSTSLDQINDEVAAMQRQESEFYYNKTHLNRHNAFRPYIAQWMLTIHDTFQLCPVVVPTAMYYLDNTPCGNTPLDYQLCGLTALHLATKVHETRIFQLKQLLSMGNVCFTEQNVLDMESRILTACNWKLHPPVPEAFVFVLGKLFSRAPQVPSNAFQVLRQGMQINTPGKPSIIAYASLLVAMERANISVEQKQALCLDVLKVSGFSATTPGLSEAFKALAGPQQCASPITTQPQQVTHHIYPVHSPPPQPMVVNQAPMLTSANDLLSPESRDEGEYREVITCAAESIEVTMCCKPGADLLDSISPKNVGDFDTSISA